MPQEKQLVLATTALCSGRTFYNSTPKTPQAVSCVGEVLVTESETVASVNTRNPRKPRVPIQSVPICDSLSANSRAGP